MRDEDRNYVLQIYLEIGRRESHLGSIQNSYKKLAASWILAAFSAIGFILFKYDQEINVMVNVNLTLLFICNMINFGIFIVWILDFDEKDN